MSDLKSQKKMYNWPPLRAAVVLMFAVSIGLMNTVRVGFECFPWISSMSDDD